MTESPNPAANRAPKSTNQTETVGHRPSVDEICLSNPDTHVDTHPSVPAIYPAAVYQCSTTQQADEILGGMVPGFAYQRDAHPNASRLAEKCRQLHHAAASAITSSGMAALSAIVLGRLEAGDHILVSNQMYGRSSVLLEQQIVRFGIECQTFDPCDLQQIQQLHRPGKTRMVLAETISNPLIRVTDIPRLVEMGKQLDFEIAIDNTFATPYLCQPLNLGVDWVWESYSKMLNGHSDVMMGLVCGKEEGWEDIRKAVSTWGLSSAPFECYLAERGLTTFGLRIRQSIENARQTCRLLDGQPAVAKVHYAGKVGAPDRAWLEQVFTTDSAVDKHTEIDGLPGDNNGSSKTTPQSSNVMAAGNVISIELAGQADGNSNHSPQVNQFLQASQIPYYPSLGECNTTISHPCSSSHRHMSPEERGKLGISPKTMRICCGIEPWHVLKAKLLRGLESTDSQ